MLFNFFGFVIFLVKFVTLTKLNIYVRKENRLKFG